MRQCLHERAHHNQQKMNPPFHTMSQDDVVPPSAQGCLPDVPRAKDLVWNKTGKAPQLRHQSSCREWRRRRPVMSRPETSAFTWCVPS